MTLAEITPVNWARIVLVSAILFSFFWGLDALTHKRIAEKEITDKELNVHRIILLCSLLMEISLVGVYWFGWIMLPLFIATFITRTAHEFIDELKFHVGRCTQKESYLHLGMWTTVLVKTSALFIWGFIYNYNGIMNLPFYYYLIAVLVLITMSIISYFEWQR